MARKTAGGKKSAPDTKATKERAQHLATVALSPSVLAAVVAKEVSTKSFGEQDLEALMDEVAGQVRKVAAGDMSRPEAMLVAQMHALNSIFTALMQRASWNMGEYPQTAWQYTRLALKAQAQTASTIEILAALKNPQPVAFVKQANFAAGHQQVNNGVAPAGNSENKQNGLLEQQHALDTRATAAAVPSNQDLATVGAVHRAADTRG